MKLYVDSLDASQPGNPAYDIPGPLLFLFEDRVMKRHEGQGRIHVPMQNMFGSTWDELYMNLETALYVPVVGDDRALVYRALTVLGGGTSSDPEVFRQADIGVLYGVPHLEGWAQYPDLKTWWGTLDLAGLDRRFWELSPKHAGL